MTHRIQLDDLIGDVPLYQPHLMRTPIAPNTKPSESDIEITHASAKTAQDILRRAGMTDVEVSDEDVMQAEQIFMQHVTQSAPATIQKPKPQSVLMLDALLREYDHKVIQHADQIRKLVTNKLLMLSDNRDPKVQLKALEMLGKIADVGMFVEKQEITYKQQPTEVLEQKLKEKLGLLIEGEIVEDPITPIQPLSTDHAQPLPVQANIDITDILND